MIEFFRRLFRRRPAPITGATTIAEPGFYPPGPLGFYSIPPTKMEAFVTQQAFGDSTPGDPTHLELTRAIAHYELFGLGEPAGTREQRFAVCAAYEEYVCTRWLA